MEWHPPQFRVIMRLMGRRECLGFDTSIPRRCCVIRVPQTLQNARHPSTEYHACNALTSYSLSPLSRSTWQAQLSRHLTSSLPELVQWASE